MWAHNGDQPSRQGMPPGMSMPSPTMQGAKGGGMMHGLPVRSAGQQQQQRQYLQSQPSMGMATGMMPAGAGGMMSVTANPAYVVARDRVMWLVQTCALHGKLDVLWEVLEPLVPTVLNSYRCPCCLHARNFANCGKFYGATTPVCKTCSRKFVTLVRGGVTTAADAVAHSDDADPSDINRLFMFMKADSVGKGSRKAGSRKRRSSAVTPSVSTNEKRSAARTSYSATAHSAAAAAPGSEADPSAKSTTASGSGPTTRRRSHAKPLPAVAGASPSHQAEPTGKGGATSNGTAATGTAK